MLDWIPSKTFLRLLWSALTFLMKEILCGARTPLSFLVDGSAFAFWRYFFKGIGRPERRLGRAPCFFEKTLAMMNRKKSSTPYLIATEME